MSKSTFDVNEERRDKYKTRNNKYSDFPVGSRVQVICVMQDMSAFSGDETGIVVENSGKYLGIIVKFDKPRHYETFNFAPDDLVLLEPQKESRHSFIAMSHRLNQALTEIKDIIKKLEDEVTAWGKEEKTK
jgi:hypothetical protein